MILLEIAIVFSLLITIIIVIRSSYSLNISIIMRSITLVLVLLHLVFFGVKWQLVPAYIVFVIIALSLYGKDKWYQIITKPFRITIVITASLLLFISFVSVIVFPVEEIPMPTGENLIGTTTVNLVDQSRIELYSNVENENRRFRIQLWYPTDTTEGYEQVPWLQDGIEVARSLALDTGLPFFVLDHTVDILSHSYLEAPLKESSQPYPIVVISHGWRGFRNLHTDFAEELASHGYVVVSIDHVYGSVASVLEEEDIIYLNLDALPPRDVNPDFLEDANNLVATYGGDVIRTLDYLQEINSDSDSIFYQMLDVESIGVVGHSTGGGGDVYAAINDNRIDALIGLDAWVEPLTDEEINQGLDIPSLFLRSGSWEEGPNNVDLLALIETSSVPSTFYQIEGTTHFDFSMVYMYSPLTPYIGFTGEVEGRYLNQMLSKMIVTFFNQQLRGETTTIDPTEWPEITIID
jgi:hypothetical protein